MVLIYKDLCDMNFIRVKENFEKIVCALIDNRRTSAFAYSACFVREKIAYYPVGFSHMKGDSKNDPILRSKSNLLTWFNDNIPTTCSMFVKGIVVSTALCFLLMRLFD
ncbi:MAG TPA: hypothetical protein DEG92_01070 [Rikenellaceae bacterium]|nr:hypothetical protein [Rikenellaceae bacterium]